MDLQTIREKIRQKVYQTRSDFFADIEQILINCVNFNG